MPGQSKLTFHRRRSPSPLVLGLIGFGVALCAVALVATPRVLAVQPDRSQEASSYSPVVITFSTAMDRASVESHLHTDPEVGGLDEWEGRTMRFLPSQPWPVGRAVEVTLQAGARAQNGLPLVLSVRWSFTPVSLRIVYLARNGAGSQLSLLPLQTGSSRTLLQTGLLIHEFAASPTGDFVVYSAGPASGGSDLYQLDLNGSSPVRILDCQGEECRYPAISRDGTQIAYQRAHLSQSAGGIPTAENARVWILNEATGEDTAVSEFDHDARTPAWGPQGWLAYYDQTSAATVVVDLRGGRTYVPDSSGSVGNWSPDGKYLIFPEIQLAQATAQATDASASPAETPPAASLFYSHLIRVTVATNEMEDLSKSPIVEDASPALSPDGKRIAFARKYLDPLHWTPGRQLWVMGIDGADPEPFTNAPDYNISSILWSPDGSSLLFVRFDETDPSQPPEIWTIQANGQSPRRLVVGGYLPQWLP